MPAKKKEVPFDHEQFAQELIVETLLRGHRSFAGSSHAGQAEAGRRMDLLAQALYPAAYRKVCGDRDRCLNGFNNLLINILGDDDGRP